MRLSIRESGIGRQFARLRGHYGLYAGSFMAGSAVAVAIFAPVISPYPPNQMSLDALLASPSPQHLLGTDNLGRDILTRLFYGARISLLVGFSSVLLAGGIGTTLGLIAGYVRGASTL
jgi:ABC-type dipeptide/oligopeptide/nickel transport system permease subunit